MSKRCPASKAATSITATIAAFVVGSAAESAGANYQQPEVIPQVAGVGNPVGVVGAGPDLVVEGGRARLALGTLIPVELRCSTSTEAGCNGKLGAQSIRGAPLTHESFELVEDEPQTVYLEAPARLSKLASRPRGWTLRITAAAHDSMDRATTEEATLTVRTPNRPARTDGA